MHLVPVFCIIFPELFRTFLDRFLYSLVAYFRYMGGQCSSDRLDNSYPPHLPRFYIFIEVYDSSFSKIAELKQKYSRDFRLA